MTRRRLVRSTGPLADARRDRDTLEQIDNRIALWMESIRETASGENPDPLGPSIDDLLQSLRADLAARDRRVAAQAWSEGHQDGWADRAHPGSDQTRNPYRADTTEGTHHD